MGGSREITLDDVGTDTRIILTTGILSYWKTVTSLEVIEVILLKFYTSHPDVSIGKRKAKERPSFLYISYAKISINVSIFYNLET